MALCREKRRRESCTEASFIEKGGRLLSLERPPTGVESSSCPYGGGGEDGWSGGGGRGGWGVGSLYIKLPCCTHSLCQREKRRS